MQFMRNAALICIYGLDWCVNAVQIFTLRRSCEFIFPTLTFQGLVIPARKIPVLALSEFSIIVLTISWTGLSTLFSVFRSCVCRNFSFFLSAAKTFLQLTECDNPKYLNDYLKDTIHEKKQQRNQSTRFKTHQIVTQNGIYGYIIQSHGYVVDRIIVLFNF